VTLHVNFAKKSSIPKSTLLQEKILQSSIDIFGTAKMFKPRLKILIKSIKMKKTENDAGFYFHAK